MEGARRRGRPLKIASPARRNEVIGALDTAGGRLSLPWLREHFPDVARAELADLRVRWRRMKRVRRAGRVLHWHRAGAVWAVDYSEAPSPVDGRCEWVLAARDLASGCVLWWQAAARATAETAAAALAALFRQWGKPLVLKADNGGHFQGAAVAGLLEAEGVTMLRSPPYTPRYNGAIEAGIGSLKARTHEAAARHGRPGQWTSDDLEEARQEANEFAQPRGENGPSPAEAWAARTPIGEEERRRFVEAVEKEVAEREQAGYDAGWGAEQRQQEQAKRRREAISAVLVAQEHLSYAGRRIPPPIPKRTVS